MRVIVTVLFCSFASFTFCQEKGVKKEGAHQAEFNADGQERDHSAEMDSRHPNDESERVDESAIPSNDSLATDGPASASNTAGTDTRTTSSSGSPAILMTDQDEPGGTNTMQRASMNTAGSPLPGSSNEKAIPSDERSDNRKMSPAPRERKPTVKKKSK